MSSLKDKTVTMAHGAGGRQTSELIDQIFAAHFANPDLTADDAAVLTPPAGKMAVSTDGFIVSPAFFPGGNIGKLSICGTVNDLACMGAKPLYLTCAFVIEEGFPIKMVIPNDGAGYELEASSLMSSAKNKADAKRFLDWTLSPTAAAIYTKYKEIVTIPGAPQSKAAKAAGLPADLSKVLYPIDFAKSAKEREATLTAWQKNIGR